MVKKRRIRNFFSSAFNFKAWMGYQNIKSGANIITSTVHSFTNLEDTSQYPTEDFESGLQRLNITEEQRLNVQNGYYRNFLIFFILGSLFAIYSIYRFYNAQWVAGLISLALTIGIYVLSLAMHFWYFQIKNKKLGCSFKEWFANKID